MLNLALPFHKEVINEPLYITNLVQGKKPPVDFVAGNKDGLTQIEHLPSK
ncbi:MAG: hypothetical protein J6P95_05920 [Paludibacteraceae bacterium]|nr:hypothetical protein [Paludibacteraceae bacterium]